MTMDYARDTRPDSIGLPHPVLPAGPLRRPDRASEAVTIVARAVAELLRSEQLSPLSEMQVQRMGGRGARRLVRRVYLAHGIALDEASVGQRAEALRELAAGVVL
jgi:hypothetical protein